MGKQEKRLPIPAHFDPAGVESVWRVPYEDRAAEAEAWARRHRITSAAQDDFAICLLLVDVQNTFCLPEFELFVAGRSGRGAIEDNRRLCAFIYRNLHRISRMVITLDTHQALQIFHPAFLVDEDGDAPAPHTRVRLEEVEAHRWRVNPAAAQALGLTRKAADDHLRRYVRSLRRSGKFDLTIWPYHAMLGGIGHALVSSVEEAVFFHSIARRSNPHFHLKGHNPLTEHYSALKPEVRAGAQSQPLFRQGRELVDLLSRYDAVVIAGQAKSHCVAWTVQDLVGELKGRDARLLRKLYLLEDCMSAVVVPDVVDFTDETEATFRGFADAGINVVRSSQPFPGRAPSSANRGRPA